MPDRDLSGVVLDGRYQVIEPIAEGAMGSVYRGERLKLGRAVAIKIMHEELPDELASRQRFEREAKLMARLEHPHCVSVIDFGVHEEKPFLVMDLVRGTSLLEIVDKQGRLDPARASDIVRQVLSGLGHAHELGIIHRDIKPANVMVTERSGGEQVRILDFGLARLTDGGTKLTTGIVVGTPNYMAPEQCKGGDIDARTDLYACGVVLFELLTGRKPFVADEPIQVVRKHLLEPPPKLRDVAPALELADFEPIVARALAKAPADRFASAAEMSAALDAALARRGQVALAIARAVPTVAATSGPAPVATPSGWAVPAGTLAAPSAPALVAAEPSAPFVAPSIATPPAPPPPRSASPALPVTPKQLAIGGGGLLGAIVIIAIVASHHGSSSAPARHDAGIVAHASIDATEADPITPLVARITEQLAADEPEAALDLALKARRRFPDSAPLAYLAGRAYFAKLYWTDGIKNFRDAIRLDPRYRDDPELIKIALRGFNTTPGVDDRLEEFIRDDIGAAAKPFLEETARNHPNATVRARAAAELRRLR